MRYLPAIPSHINVLKLSFPASVKMEIHYDDYEEIKIDRYRVKIGFTYLDPDLGWNIEISAGDYLDRIVDDPKYFSNGLAIIPEVVIEKRIAMFEAIEAPRTIKFSQLGPMTDPELIRKILFEPTQIPPELLGPVVGKNTGSGRNKD